MVAAFIWGPMQWRMLHGLAFLYDNTQKEKNPTIFYNYMKSMAGILPCQTCRADCTAEFKRNGQTYAELIRTNCAQFAVFQLHNFVNKKLNRDVVAVRDFDMVRHRSRLWGNEFTTYGTFGFLFLIALNYCTAIEEESANDSLEYAYGKIDAAYHAYFWALEALLRFVGMDALAASMKNCTQFVSDIDSRDKAPVNSVCNKNNVSVNLFYILHAEYNKHGFVEDNMTIMNRFTDKDQTTCGTYEKF